MKKYITYFLVLFATVQLQAQAIDNDLLAVKTRMDSIQQFTASITLDLDVSFINMPTKHADMSYTKGKEIDFSSDDFVMLPKKGLDFSLSELFKYPFITVDRGTTTQNETTTKTLNIIPTDDKADFALATLVLDITHKRVSKATINTKKNGSYTISMQYQGTKAILPDYVEVTFAIERLKIPLNFMGNDTKIDRKEMRQAETKEGKIMMGIANYKITY